MLSGPDTMAYHDDSDMSDGDDTPCLSKAEYRSQIIQEIVSTEHDYGKDLRTTVEQFLQPMKQHASKPGALFGPEVVQAIFANLEQIDDLQRKFLYDLERCSHDQLGGCFLDHAAGFKIYSVYCNNYPQACSVLEDLQAPEENQLQMMSFFEGMRLIAGTEHTLEAFLLTPIQRICKYPLLLNELLKATAPDSPGYKDVTHAVEAMKEVAEAINEEKRSVEQLSVLQSRLEGWQGADLDSISSVVIHEGALMKISGNKCQERYFFLFDNMLVYCKRGLTGGFQVKGQLSTETMAVVDIPDGSHKVADSKVANAFKIHNQAKNKWYVLYSKTHEDKQAWLQAFLAERKKVAEDKRIGLTRSGSNSNMVRQLTRSKSKSVKRHSVHRKSRLSVGSSVDMPKASKSPKGRRRSSATTSSYSSASATSATTDDASSSGFDALEAEALGTAQPKTASSALSKDSMAYASKPVVIEPSTSVRDVIMTTMALYGVANVGPEEFALVWVSSAGDSVLAAGTVIYDRIRDCPSPRFYIHHESLPDTHWK
eukprot:m.7094 g.7094  ORF g.7094 m.7094 type:complete len:540 (-) comp2809_c0_seq1:137-1756(-)